MLSLPLMNTPPRESQNFLLSGSSPRAGLLETLCDRLIMHSHHCLLNGVPAYSTLTLLVVLLQLSSSGP